MGISSPGMGSGLDVSSIVEKLVSSDITPASNRLDKRESTLKMQLSALGQVKSNLSKLQSTAQRLSSLKEFYNLKTSITSPEALNATVGEKAVPGSYQIEIQQLASKHNLSSAAFPGSTQPVGTGSITIAFGTYSTDKTTFTPNTSKSSITLNITSGQNSLINIRDMINKSNSGVNASIVTDNSGAHLMISGPDTGANMAMQISVSDDDGNNTDNAGLSQLAYDPTIGVTQLTQETAAQNSQVLINGLLLTNSSNQLKTAIDGITLDLKKAETSTSPNIITLNIENNKDQITNNVQEFIKQYNETLSSLNAMTGYNKATKQAGALQSDAGLRMMKLKLYEFASQPLNAEVGPLKSLADLGITSNPDGLLVLNGMKFNKVLDDNFNDIGKVFAKSATATDSNITIDHIGKNIKAGAYNVNLSAFTSGSVLTGTIGEAQANSTDGITLTGSGNLSSLAINVLGGGTGNRGDIIVTDGLASRLDTLIDSYFGTTGDFTERTKQLTKQSDLIADDRKALSVKANNLAKRYKAQFETLDLLISNMNKTSAYLSQQLDRLPK